MPTPADSQSGRLSKSTLFYYGLTDMPIWLSVFPIAVFIPRFYASDVGVSLALIGTIMFTQRIFDMFTDPLMGYISDRVSTPWGRRRPWVVIATPIMMLSIYMLFMPAEGAGGWYLFTWLMLLSIGTTIMLIPYYAWGAELTADYNERSRVTGWRAQLGTCGQLFAQLIPALAGLLIFWGLVSPPEGLQPAESMSELVIPTDFLLQLVGITMLVIMPVCVFLTVWKTPRTGIEISSRVPVLEGMKLMVRNGPFLRLVGAFTIGHIGLSITTPLYAFFIFYVLGAEGQEIYMLLFFYLTNLAAVPFWVWLSKQIGKHNAYIAAFVLISCAHPFYLLLGEGDFWWMLPVTIVTGFAAGGFSQALPNSMKADVIDYDQLQSGENRAAQFFATWSFAIKFAAALGVFIATMSLELWGFDPARGAVNSEEQLFGLRFLFSTLPSLFYLTGALIVWKYPITEERHAEIRRALDERAAAAG